MDLSKSRGKVEKNSEEISPRAAGGPAPTSCLDSQL